MWEKETECEVQSKTPSGEWITGVTCQGRERAISKMDWMSYIDKTVDYRVLWVTKEVIAERNNK